MLLLQQLELYVKKGSILLLLSIFRPLVLSQAHKTHKNPPTMPKRVSYVYRKTGKDGNVSPLSFCCDIKCESA